MSNPLNIRAGDVTEFTGESWSPSKKGQRREVTSVESGGVYYSGGHHLTNPPEGFEYVVHYAVRDGDQYRYIRAGMAGETYTYSGGEPYFQRGSESRRASFSKEFVTSAKFVRLASEASPVAEAEPELVGQWESASIFNPVKDGDRVRFTGSEKEYQARMVKDHQGFNAVSVELAPGFHHQCLYQDIEVFREVIQPPTEFGHYESIHEGITYNLSEYGWSKMNGGERVSISREQVEESAPLTRIITADEADECKQQALARQREKSEGKRTQARARHDRYQEELMTIIRRRNEENLRLRELLEEAGIKW